jgi:hypothetical protein
VETAAAELETALDKLIEGQNIPENAQSRTRTAKEIFNQEVVSSIISICPSVPHDRSNWIGGIFAVFSDVNGV